jgi:hypothetical protein
MKRRFLFEITESGIVRACPLVPVGVVCLLVFCVGLVELGLCLLGIYVEEITV